MEYSRFQECPFYQVDNGQNDFGTTHSVFYTALPQSELVRYGTARLDMRRARLFRLSGRSQKKKESSTYVRSK
jgi:hypothetical protein